ncbi:MAG: lyase family protein [Candidatus Thermoplasmatota archaeon]|jgi:aspartate ammonia-lyase|nr:lyase family protein [Candidatus Thermoplasmatota archaeon]
MVRKERDSLGEVEIPEGRLYGPETVRALSNFPYYRFMDRRIIDTLIVIKRSYVRAFTSKGKISKEIGEAIIKAADELLKNKNDLDFPLKYIQAGAGTSTNMNVNEVIANKALEMMGKALGSHDIISPHNQVNIGQSTNDTIPAAIRISAYFALKALSKNIEKAIDRFELLSNENSTKIKTGRTHIQDASAVTFGGEFKAYADELRSFLDEKDYILTRLKRLNLGGTAVGTGANLPPEVKDLVYKNINEYYKESFLPAENLMMVMQFTSDFNLLASWLSNFSAALIKISRDLRMMNSGPVAGLNEIVLPAVQPGSSIMPGKVNPSILEAVTMSALFVRGLAQTVNDASSQGEMEINVFTPIIYTALMEAFDVLTVTLTILEEKTLKGIKINSEYAYEMLLNSPGTALLLNPVIGYEKTAEIVKEAKEKNVPFLKLLRERRILTEEQIDKIFGPENMLNK